MSMQNAKGGDGHRSELKGARHDGSAMGFSPLRPGDFHEDDWVKYLRDKGVLRGWRRDGSQADSIAFVMAAGSYEDFYLEGSDFSRSVSDSRQHLKQSAKQTSNTDTGWTLVFLEAFQVPKLN
jgi:hypothetical protein